MSMRVLIVDPDWRFSNQAAAFLESRAHLVVRQDDPQQAIAVALRWQPDLAIVSEELAETGIIEELCQMSPRPALLLVGWMDRYDRIWRAWQQGGDELLMKPVFKSEEIHQAVVSAMENAAAGVPRQAVSIPA